jgi:hypothetical protein
MHGRILEVQTREGPFLIVDQCYLGLDQVEAFIDALRDARNCAGQGTTTEPYLERSNQPQKPQ